MSLQRWALSIHRGGIESGSSVPTWHIGTFAPPSTSIHRKDNSIHPLPKKPCKHEIYRWIVASGCWLKLFCSLLFLKAAMLPRQGEEKLEGSVEVIAWGASLPLRHAKRVQECSLQEDDSFMVLCRARATWSFCYWVPENRILKSLLAEYICTEMLFWHFLLLIWLF